jgi:hypothetical protein
MKSKTNILVILLAGGWVLFFIINTLRKLMHPRSGRHTPSMLKPVYRGTGYLKALTILFLLVTNAFVFLPAFLYKQKEKEIGR